MNTMDDMKLLLGELKEFKKSSEEMFEMVRKDLQEIREEIKQLNQLKWRIAGGAAVLSLLMSALATLMRLK